MTSLFNMQQTVAVKRIVYLWLLFLLPLFSKAQDDKFDGDIWKGDYWRSIYVDPDGNKINVTRYYKGRTNEKERLDSIVEFKDGSRLETKIIFVAGDTLYVFQYYYDATKQLRYERTKHFDVDGKLDSDDTNWKSTRGNPTTTRTYDPIEKKYTTKQLRDGKWVEVSMATPTEVKTDNEYSRQMFASDRPRNSTPQFELTASYSYLRTGNGASALGFPLGFELSANYNLNRKLGAIIDVSYHSGEKNDQQYDREYAMAGIEYSSNDCCCDEGPVISTRLLLGYGRDGYKFMNYKNSNNGFVAALGAGLGFKLNQTASIVLKTDAIADFLNDDMQIDYRASIGATFNFGKRPSIRKYPNLTTPRGL